VPPRAGLFTEAPPAPLPAQYHQPIAPVAAPRNSLFGIVTGAIRGRSNAAPPPPAQEPQRAEPLLSARVEGTPSVRQVQTEEMGLEIPAFLRRQSS
jgi:cell division protein FtsZ